jgi:hypothetical protein
MTEQKSKLEFRNPKQTSENSNARKIKTRAVIGCSARFGASCFEFVSRFDIRISDLELLGRLNEPEQDRHGDGGVADKEQPGENAAAEREARLDILVVQSERLKKTR